LHVDDESFGELSPGETGERLKHWLRVLGHAAEADWSKVEERAGRASIVTHVHAGHPPEEILKLAGRLGVDLIVMATQGRGGRSVELLGSVTETVVRHAPCPVLCVGPGRPDDAAEPPVWRRLLCAVDFSETSRRGMIAAVDLARQFGAELVLLHVCSPAQREEAERMLALWKRRARGTTVTALTVSGSPATEIVQIAQERGCDLIVIGTHGRTGLARQLFGSVAETVVRMAPSPVLTVHLVPSSPRRPTASPEPHRQRRDMPSI